MKKIGLSTSSWQVVEKDDDKKVISLVAKTGADAIDFSLDRNDYRDSNSIYSKSDEEITEYYTELRKYAENLGLFFCQTHGRLPGFKNIREEDDALIENSRIDFLATKALGAPVCVVHNATSIFMGASPEPELMHKLSYCMFTRMLPFAKQYGVKLATETFGDAVVHSACDFFGNIDEFMRAYNDVKMIEEYREWFTTCVDTGHSNKAMRYNNPKPADVIRRIGSDISVLHLNDNDTVTDQHKIPMTGTIDWKDTMKALEEIGYSGVYNMELDLRHFGEKFVFETASFAVKVMRNILENM